MQEDVYCFRFMQYKYRQQSCISSSERQLIMVIKGERLRRGAAQLCLLLLFPSAFSKYKPSQSLKISSYNWTFLQDRKPFLKVILSHENPHENILC